MRIPEHWAELDEVDSTQNVAGAMLCEGEPVGVVFAYHQVIGRGRFGREWMSARGDSLTMSIAFTDYPAQGVSPAEGRGAKKPWLIGMAVACAAARVLGCRVRWPNDLSFELPGLGDRKVGGILTELLTDAHGHPVPVVGIGINVRQNEMPLEIQDRATSLAIARPDADPTTALDLALDLTDAIRAFPEPTDWSVLEPIWHELDATPGKRYTLATGETVRAIRVGEGGRLIAEKDGEEIEVLAADAIFGPTS